MNLFYCKLKFVFPILFNRSIRFAALENIFIPNYFLITQIKIILLLFYMKFLKTNFNVGPDTFAFLVEQEHTFSTMK